MAALAIALAFAASESLGGTGGQGPLETASDKEEAKWEGSISVATYLVQNGRDYANPNVSADRDWLHLEARYNYEAIKTGSFWLGCNYSTGDKLTLDVTPMVGGVFGNITGVAPGYTITLGYKPFELYTQGEYFFDAGTKSGNFFYTWSELSVAPASWCRVGFVVDRTKALGDKFEIRRGPFVGVQYHKIDFTTYWLSPGTIDGTFVFAVTLNF